MSDDTSTSGRGPEREAWDQFGEYLQAMGSLGERTWTRSLGLWTDVAGTLDKDVTTGSMSANSARAMAVMQKNLADALQTFTTMPNTRRTASVLPTAFLSLVPGDDKDHPYSQLEPPIEIAAPGDLASPPALAQIVLRVTSLDGGPKAPTEATAVKRVTDRLRASYQKGSHTYLLERFNPEKDPGDPVPGAYEGFVYLSGPPAPLANLRIVVEGPKGNG